MTIAVFVKSFKFYAGEFIELEKLKLDNFMAVKNESMRWNFQRRCLLINRIEIMNKNSVLNSSRIKILTAKLILSRFFHPAVLFPMRLFVLRKISSNNKKKAEMKGHKAVEALEKSSAIRKFEWIRFGNIYFIDACFPPPVVVQSLGPQFKSNNWSFLLLNEDK